MKGLLIDSTLCIGCRACQVSCKEWNDLPAEKTQFFGGPVYQNPADLSFSTWTLITFLELANKNNLDLVYGKRQCMHCLDAACIANCPEEIIYKTAEGATVHPIDECIGCRSCEDACPFDVPRYEPNIEEGKMAKCTMCADRLQAGMKTACATACPTSAITFGDREALLAEARKRFGSGKYVETIYGEQEAAGTSVLHISDVEIGKLGHKTGVKAKTYGYRLNPTFKKARVLTAAVFNAPLVAASAVGLYAFSWIVKRRDANRENPEE